MSDSTNNRITGSITSISWIPSEAIAGFMRLPMDVGLGQYDQTPPDRIDDLHAFVAAERCRFANQLVAWADIVDGRIVASGSSGGGMIAGTRVGPGSVAVTVPPIAYPEIRSTEWSGSDSVTFVQTAGGRTGAPFPRRAGRKRRFKMSSPTAWTTLAVTLHANGSVHAEPRGASQFPRHWFYDDAGELIAKSATIDFGSWSEGIHDEDTPWGDAEQEVRATACESALERTLSTMIMGGRTPHIRDFNPGDLLMRQGEPASTMDLLLDGVVEIEVDGRVLAESGPGAVIGERAFLEGGRRTATVRAATKVKAAVADPSTFDPEELRSLRELHQREQLSS